MTAIDPAPPSDLEQGMMASVPGWWIHRTRRRLAAAQTLLPLRWDLAKATLLRHGVAWTRGLRGQVLLLAAIGGVTFLVLALFHPDDAAILGLAGAATLAWIWASRQRRLRTIANRGDTPDGLRPAHTMLLELGLEPAVVERVVREALGGERRLAIFDYDSRLLSDVGPIPFFGATQISPAEFKERDRHNLELVILRGVVCIKKRFRDRASFEKELLALHAMDGLQGVPRLITADVRSCILYQSFIPGQNLGTMMLEQGATDQIQQRVSETFAGDDRWEPAVTAEARATAVAALRRCLPSEAVASLGELMIQIHQRGVTIGDIKYGNVLLTGGAPSLCDFDFAAVFPKNSWRCARGRDIDREKFNYFFDAGVLSEREFRRRMERLLSERPAFRAGRIHYGFGSVNQPDGSLAAGSGIWRVLRDHLPDPAGRRILVLGTDVGLTSMELLRGGAAQVTILEADPVIGEYLRLNHQWFEFIDNRRYPALEVDSRPLAEAAERDWAGYHLALGFGGLEAHGPGWLDRLVGHLSQSVELVVLGAGSARSGAAGAMADDGLATLRLALTHHGYVEQAILDGLVDAPPLVIGRRRI
jgi:tRNA A-37 threonylcarbamoyl transferase component Bud32